jgi:LysM repeat protein
MTFRKWVLPVAAAVLTGVAGGCEPGQNSLDEEKEPHFVLGNSRVNAMDYEGAIEAFQESLEVNPRSAAAHFRLACLYDKNDTKESDPAAAIFHYQEYLRLDPKADNADVIKGHIYSCKQQLAADVLQMPSASAAQQQLEKIVEQNRQLQQRVDELTEKLRQWNVYYAKQKSAPPNPSPAPNNSQTPVSGSPTPDDISSQSNPAPQTPPARNSHTAASPPAKPKPHTHTVAAGETLAAIARKANVSLNSLLAANPGVDPKKLHVGQTVNLPQ